MQTLYFVNPGEIDRQLITTLGVNVKDADSPIGYFGTGLKFAIAVVLRGRGQIRIWVGESLIEFFSEPRTIRGKEFQIVILRENNIDRELSFTVDLGRNWEPWMALRELWSNAKDEGGESGERAVAPAAGKTVIEIEGEAFLQAWGSRASWLLETQPILRTEKVNVHHGRSQYGFYQNLRVIQWGKPSLYTYNVNEALKLTEDRTCASYAYYAPLCQGLAKFCQDREFLKEILTAQDSFLEHDLDWTWCFGRPGEVFVSVVDELYDSHFATLNRSAVRLCESQIKKRIPRASELTKVEQMMLSKALAFLAKNQHEISEPITVVDSLGSQWCMGLAAGGRIYLPKSSFGKGTKFLASTLLEEHLHLSRNLPDESRALQDWLFDKVLSLMEELQGEPL